MDLGYRRFAPSEAEPLADFLAGEVWPFHSAPVVDKRAVARWVADGYYDGGSARTFWIVADGTRAGVVRMFDLDDGTPLFDLRIGAAWRGRGIGTHAVGWLTRYLFTEFPAVNRIEGTTRRDNRGMRRVFRRCGYAKEAHYRQAWPGGDGTLHDTVGYAILRSDWLSGTVTPPDFYDEHG
ncbi:GNAT family N-acetyltransferase [Amycolatopsis anabasis]|uniref:GNAT family N-acetyltransferase n=1 Tax=Amycolatopsis anabasis TaxID=1840409 RepID=UPI001C552F62|nr:GNAT family protein [Amycolatopsis anabasis]